MSRIEDALLVMVLNPKINAFLKSNDPKAFAQAHEALQAEGAMRGRDPHMIERFIDARRNHCNIRPTCGGLVSRCDCKCGACTARYGEDGVWR